MNANPTSSTLDLDAQKARALAFAALHDVAPLILPNAWDAGSAGVLEEAGARAIATTSGGCSWSIGVPDGGHLQRDQVVDLIGRIVRIVAVPVTADIETGYGESLDELAATVRAVIAAGAVGINIEDSGQDPLYGVDEQAERIATVRRAADALGVPLFINARTDVFLFGVGEERSRLDQVITRAKAYAAAGASGLFVPGLLDLPTLRQLCDRVSLPVNAMTGPGAPTVAELVNAGVTRISAGTALAQTAYAHARRAARELLISGTCSALEETIGYGELNAIFAGNRRRGATRIIPR